MVLGLALIIGSLALSAYNQKQDNTARDSVAGLLPELIQQIEANTDTEQDLASEEDVYSDPALQVPVELLPEAVKKMTEVEIDGHKYIGYLSLPTLGMDFPIMSTWSYPQLNIAPCRFTGSVRGENLVLMAHNYQSHFGKISQLSPGDSVIFTDMDGVVTYYTVVGEDILAPTDVEEMISGDFDLTLFTCTYGGASRVTVYCDIVK